MEPGHNPVLVPVDNYGLYQVGTLVSVVSKVSVVSLVSVVSVVSQRALVRTWERVERPLAVLNWSGE